MEFCDCAREMRYLLRNRQITRTMYNLNNTLRFRFYHEYVGIVNFFYFLTFFCTVLFYAAYKLLNKELLTEN